MNEPASAPGDILVPLDGSDVSELALPLASSIAAATGAGLRLFTVPELYGIDVAWYAEGMMTGPLVQAPLTELMSEAKEEAGRYLEGHSQALRGRGLRVTAELGELEPGQAIVDAAGAQGVWMVAMATHGRSGISRWAFGTVTDEVLHRAPQPVLVVRTHIGGRPEDVRRILVPLDGSERAEQVLDDAIALARGFGATLLLLHVAEEPVMALPGAILADRTRHVDEMRAYLTAKVELLAGLGVSAEAHLPDSASVAAAILEFEREHDVDLVAMTSHGRSGRLWAVFGSVADRVIRGGAAPVLVRRVS